MAQAFRSRALSPREVVDACLKRIESVDREVNAFCLVDADGALAQAVAAERRFLSNEPLGPLDGVPIAIKDLLLTRGWPTLRGSRAVPSEGPWVDDAPSVGRLRRQGCVFVGKTTTPELGWKAVTDSPLTGVTRNPWNTDCTSGGSSGGSAAAVACGMAPLALGTDGGGSIRIPAAFCGIAGLKPTLGRVPHWPSTAFGSLSHVGPMARSVRDAGVLLTAIAGPDPLDPTTLPSTNLDYGAFDDELRGTRIAFSFDMGLVAVDSEVVRLVKRAVSLLESLGAVVSEDTPCLGDNSSPFEVLWYAGAAKAVDSLRPENTNEMDHGLVDVANIGRTFSAMDYLGALAAKVATGQALDQFFQGYDILVTPTIPFSRLEPGLEVPSGWPNKRWTSWATFNYPFNMTGNPAISIPCGFDGSGIPVGVQVIGPRYADNLVLGCAGALELASGLRDRHPTMD